MSGPTRWTVATAALLTAAPGPASAAAPETWDVTDTAQPFVEATFDLREGTWMSLDVSPDGRTIVFDLLGDIYTMPAAGGEARPILDGPAMQRSPVFSRDGRSIAFISDRGGSDNVWVARADGSEAAPVTHETVDLLTGPAWGPDDDSVAAAWMESSVARLHASEIRLYDLRGGKAGRVLVEAPANRENVHEVEFSPDGRHAYYTEKVSAPSASVVYIDANHANYAIRRRDLTNGATETVVAGFGGATTPRLSPDGHRLAFVRRVKDRTVLFVHDLESLEQRPLFDGLDRDAQADFIGQGHYYPRYAWFPDGRHLAIWARGRIHRVDARSGASTEIPFRATARHRITMAPRFEHELSPATVQVRAIRQPAVSPAADRIAFFALGQVWQQALPIGEPRRIGRGSDFEFEPAYAPDGARIAYVTWNDERGASLNVVAAAGGVPRAVMRSRGVLRQPAFSPDGTTLVYRVGSGDKCMGGFHERPGLYLVPVTGGASRRIAGEGDAPRFSPDGRRVLFTTTSYEGDDTVERLESVTIGGHDRRTHAIARGADTSELRLSPDARWIAFRERQQYYLAPYRETGAPLDVGARSTSVPVTALTALGGYGLTWRGDAGAAYWMLGPDVYRHDVAAGAERETLTPFAAIRLTVPGDAPQGLVAFTNARVVTMRGDEVIERGTVLVDGNRIAAVGESGAVEVPASARVIDAGGRTVMPGLVNMHGHIDDCYYSSAGLMPQKEASMYASLAFGITTNYDPYTSELARYAAAEMNLAGVRVGPRTINSGSVAYGRSGKSDAVYVPIESYADAQRFMARKSALGGRVVKSYRQPARRQRQQLVKAGREAGIMLDAEGESHLYNNVTMVLDGYTAIEHNFPVATYYDDLVQLLAHSQTATTPTLIAHFGELMGENYIYQTTRPWEDERLRTYVQSTTSGYSPLATPYAGPPYARGMTTIHVAEELWDVGFRAAARSMKRLDDAGVLVNAGSHGQVHGIDQHWEMWLLASGGMSPHRVLRTSTLNGARTLGLERQIGSLEPGKLADLIVLDADPLEDIRNTNSVRYTMVNGRLYDARSMHEIGNYDRRRSRFFWELADYTGLDWNETWAEH